eukprot:173510_1
MKSTMSFESFNEHYLANSSSGHFVSNSKSMDPSSSFIQNPANKVNNYNTQQQQQQQHNHQHNSNSNSFQFHPQITTFSINMVDEEEIPEEKMHSPRTPYGSVPDPSTISKHNNGGHQQQHFSYQQQHKQSQSQYLYPSRNSNIRVPHMNQHQNIEPMQRTISASSFESNGSYSAATFDTNEQILYHTPTLSATSSINRSGIYSAATSPHTTPNASPCTTPKQNQPQRRQEQRFPNEGDDEKSF